MVGLKVFISAAASGSAPSSATFQLHLNWTEMCLVKNEAEVNLSQMQDQLFTDYLAEKHVVQNLFDLGQAYPNLNMFVAIYIVTE